MALRNGFRSVSRSAGGSVVGHDGIAEVTPYVMSYRRRNDRQDVIKNLLTDVTTD